MGNAAYRKVGQWQKANRIIRGLTKNLNALSADGLEFTGIFYADEVRLGIESQEPGGIPFKELSPLTIAAKGSDLALFDKGDLAAGVVHEMVAGKHVFVGGLRQEEHPEFPGTMENLMELHEEGSEDGHIPARPFLFPIINSQTIRRCQQRELEKYLKKRVRKHFR